MRRVIAILAAILMLCCCVFPACATEAPLDARQGVLRVYGEVYVYTSSGKEWLGGWTGSAFVVAKNDKGEATLVTNRHCVDSAFSDQQISTLVSSGYKIEDEIYIVNDDANHMIRAEVVAISKKTDLALLKVKSLKNRDLMLKIWKGDPSELMQQAVYTAGFPGAAEGIMSVKASQELRSDVDSITFADGRVTRIFDSGQTDVGEVIQHTASLNHGNSGGPLLDENGNVVGVNTWYAANYTDEDGKVTDTNQLTFWSISNRELVKFLDQNKVQYQEGQRIKKADPTKIAILSAAALAIIILIVALRQRKVNKEQSRKIEELLRKRLTQFTSIIVPKKEPKAEKNEAAPKVQPASDSAGSNSNASANAKSGRSLRCDVGALAGRNFTLTDKLVIGRDPKQCNVVFPKDATGVSRVHCTIRFRDNAVTVRDENSSYGTYMDGKRIQPGTEVPFHRGHKLGIGSADEQVFTLHSLH